jgi:DNA-binding response OmpR family regulator
MEGVPRLVVLEPSPEYAAVMECLLDQPDFELNVVEDAAALQSAVQREPVDICIVSYGALPGGEEDVRRLRGLTRAPILATVDDADETMSALSGGADYDLTKPFDPEHFLAAVQAVLRRGNHTATPSPSRTVAGLVLDPDSRTVEHGGKRRTMSEMEWRLFDYLLVHAGQVLSKSQLAEGAWGTEYSGRAAQAELYVSRIRHKIETNPSRPTLIETVRGRGYRFNTAA